MPVPAQFRSQLPREAAFDLAVTRLLATDQIPFNDFSQTINGPHFYFDTDNLNRAGMTEFFNQNLKSILTAFR